MICKQCGGGLFAMNHASNAAPSGIVGHSLQIFAPCPFRFLTPSFFRVKFKCPFTAGPTRAECATSGHCRWNGGTATVTLNDGRMSMKLRRRVSVGLALVLALGACGILVQSAWSQPPAEPAGPAVTPPADQTYAGAKACTACHFKQYMSLEEDQAFHGGLCQAARQVQDRRLVSGVSLDWFRHGQRFQG